MTFDPAFQMVTEEEAAALRLAVTYALRRGLVSDWDGGHASTRSMLSVGRKLGCAIPEFYEEGGDRA